MTPIEEIIEDMQSVGCNGHDAVLISKQINRNEFL